MAEENISNLRQLNILQNFDSAAIVCNLNRITGQIYKLLPMKEEHQEYLKPLETIYIELLGFSSLLPSEQELLLSLVCKLKGLHKEGENIEFSLYRRTIFECCNILNQITKKISSYPKDKEE